MGRLTLRLPGSLHEQLIEQAKGEGVSLNQYIVFTLTKSGTASQMTAERARFNGLLTSVGPEVAETALKELLAMREQKVG